MPGLEDLPTFASYTPNAQMHTDGLPHGAILLALVKGLADWDTKCEILSKLKQMNLDETMAFVEAREIGKRDHSGRATASVRKTSCKAYNSTCLK